MLAKRIIPCLDVKDGKVVKGIKFRVHQVMGDILTMASYYAESNADELVFYDITASSDGRRVDKTWITRIAERIDIPFCVGGGICSVKDAEGVLNAGADKISINSPALADPSLIDDLVKEFGSQCVVIGIDSLKIRNDYLACQYTGDIDKTKITKRLTKDWILEVQERGAGEIVLNCMDQDGVRQGYDIEQLAEMRALSKVPLIASGGAGSYAHFLEVFCDGHVDGALAASVFHQREVDIKQLKTYLAENEIRVRQ
jgi:imidazole glycerol-phosphate synthase subunit HisF